MKIKYFIFFFLCVIFMTLTVNAEKKDVTYHYKFNLSNGAEQNFWIKVDSKGTLTKQFKSGDTLTEGITINYPSTGFDKLFTDLVYKKGDFLPDSPNINYCEFSDRIDLYLYRKLCSAGNYSKQIDADSKDEQVVEEETKEPNDSEKPNKPSEKDGIEGLTTGEVCVSPNLKVPLKYIGWILSAIKIIVPLAIIALGVMDFMKAVASTKSDEMQKALKTVILRVIAGIVIFFVPMLVNFFFTLVDQWTNYNTYYSECTKCLFDPKNC